MFSNTVIYFALLVLFQVALRICFYHPEAPIWDAATYVSMGKYIFSAGQIGFIEPARPLLWPLLLGWFWKCGVDPMVIGLVLELIFSMGVLILTYMIGVIAFDKKTAFIASLLLGLSPVFFFWGSTQLTDIPASFFNLLAVLLFLQGVPLFAGMAAGLAINTKFVHVLLPLFLFFWYLAVSKKSGRIRQACGFAVGFAVVAALFLLAALFLYGDALRAVTDGKLVYSYHQYSFVEGVWRSFDIFFKTEGWWYAFFFVAGVWGILRSAMKEKALLVLCLTGVMFSWIPLLATEVSRFSLAGLPFFYLIATRGMLVFAEWATRLVRWMGIVLFVLLLWFVVIQVQRDCTMNCDIKLSDFQVFAAKNMPLLKGKKIWVSHPATLVYTDLKVEELIYYGQIVPKITRLHEADIVFFDSRDVNCYQADLICIDNRKKFAQRLKEGFIPFFSYGDPADIFGGIFYRDPKTLKKH